jgi:hypothetical protein
VFGDFRRWGYVSTIPPEDEPRLEIETTTDDGFLLLSTAFPKNAVADPLFLRTGEPYIFTAEGAEDRGGMNSRVKFKVPPVDQAPLFSEFKRSGKEVDPSLSDSQVVPLRTSATSAVWSLPGRCMASLDLS